jgi:subtilisin family serine protease
MKACLVAFALVLTVAPGTFAAMNGQILNCDAPHPSQPQNCVDNWALDVLDESKTALQSTAGALPRDRKHYFDATGAGVHIFILDTGVDHTNPDFLVLGDPLHNRFRSSFGFTVDGSSASHGTRVAGLAAGLQFGVAKGALIHPINSLGLIVPSGGEALLARLDWIYEQVTIFGQWPAVLNMSFNIPRPVTVEAQLTQRVRDLINAGVVVTVSAGNHNSGNPGAYWPSVIPEVILVGGVDEYGNRWVRDASDPEYHALCELKGDCGSNFGASVDIWAPAKYIRSTVRDINQASTPPRIGSGTSYAAPLVAGLAALYFEQNPWATPSQVLTALRANAAIRNIDGIGSSDFLARSAVAVPACNVTQRLFVNTGFSVAFTSTDLRDSCPAGYDAFSQFNATNGQVGIGGVGPEGVLYRYTPNLGYIGTDQFNYTIYTSSGSNYGTGAVKVMVQPDHN